MTIDGVTLSERGSEAELAFEEYREDRYVAAIKLYDGSKARLFYAVRAVSPGTYKVPSPLVEDMYRPTLRGIGEAIPATIKVVSPRASSKTPFGLSLSKTVPSRSHAAGPSHSPFDRLRANGGRGPTAAPDDVWLRRHRKLRNTLIALALIVLLDRLFPPPIPASGRTARPSCWRVMARPCAHSRMRKVCGAIR